MKKLLLCISFLLLLAAPALQASHAHTVIAQVIVSTGQDSARSSVSDSTASAPKGDDYSTYARDEKSSNTWRWIVALDLVILMLILFAISRSRRKKK
jgi:hypothetical protein